MDINDVWEALREAERTQRQVDSQVGKMAYMIAGRLRKANVNPYILDKLKRELKDYNIKTGSWRDLNSK